MNRDDETRDAFSAGFDDEQRVSLEDDWLRYTLVLLDGGEVVTERVEPDDPEPESARRARRTSYGWQTSWSDQ